ncbi:NAD(P)/FAD-dependent oxidoreductase [Quadrisphaera granulorum]|uniref:NAD(P)/FAD-dependent oxidoreductase n=1 Tax=Quadrisphaera granulorum TaxID=317664 RepID=UPI001B86E3A2|nr:FAD-binding oxidoreductase [Quadrisphaera granulorum]
MQLPTSAQVVVIGGGALGLAAADEMARAGLDVLVLERDQLGSGSSAKPYGGVRATFSDPGNIALGQRGLEKYARLHEATPGGVGLARVGYLFCARTEAEALALEVSTELQRSMGSDAEVISPARAAELNPYLDPSVLVSASFSPQDGYAQPSLAVAAWAASARALGARVVEGVKVTGIETIDDGNHRRVVGVTTTAGPTSSTSTVRCEHVIVAAGAWSRSVGEMAGIDVPVEPVRRQIAFADVPAGTPGGAGGRPLPFTLDLSTTFYVHGSPEGLLLGISDAGQVPGFGRDYDDSWVPVFDAAAAVVAPSLVGLPLRDGWAGLYENTPDHNALIGESAHVAGLVLATGFSGHGFLQAPAVGEVVRDIVLGHTPELDVSGFSPERFAPQSAAPLLREVHII